MYLRCGAVVLDSRHGYEKSEFNEDESEACL